MALTHKTGCGMTQLEPLTVLRRTLGGYARHANFSHVIILGLGCEMNQIGGFLEEQKLAGRLRSLDIQDVGGSRKTVEEAVAFVHEVARRLQQCEARAVLGERIDGGAAMRRFGRLFRRFGQSGTGCGE